LRVFVFLVTGNSAKKSLCILMVVNKTKYGNNGNVQDILLNMFLLSSPGIRNHMNLQVGAPDPVIWQGGFTDPLFPQSYQTIFNKQEFIIHNSVTRPVQYSLSTLPTMLGAALENFEINKFN
jgi:hypothetical protein